VSRAQRNIEIGRVALCNLKADKRYGKLLVIVDIIDQNRVRVMVERRATAGGMIEARVTPDPKVGAIAWAGLCARATGICARACDGLMRMIFFKRPCARGRGFHARGMVSARGLWARARGDCDGESEY